MTMTRTVALIWHRLGSIQLTVVVCLLLTADMMAGYFCMAGRTHVFEPLNRVGLVAWTRTYGVYHLEHTIWFFLLLMLLALLCLNMFVCTTDRVFRLIRAYKKMARSRFVFSLAPHIMHYAVIIILTGYLFSYAFSQVIAHTTLVPGTSATIFNTPLTIAFTGWHPVLYTGKRLDHFQERVIDPNIRLSLIHNQNRKNTTLSVNHPARMGEYRIFLKNFAPKKIGGMRLKPRIDLTIRKDPGVRFYMAGIGLFITGLLVYLGEWIFIKGGTT